MSNKKVIWKRTINVLGQNYKIYFQNYGKSFDEMGCSGWTCWDTKKIKVCNTNCPMYDKKVIRHEILHAFLFESGLQNQMTVKPSEMIHDEQMIDWWAIQFPRIYEVYKELDVLD